MIEKNEIVRMENTLAKKGTQLSMIQQKLFYIALANISSINEDSEVRLLKKDVFELMDVHHERRHEYLRQQLKNLRLNSEISFGTDEEFCDGFLIYKTRTTRSEVYLKFDKDYIPLLKELTNNYTRLLLDDCMTFNSKFSMMLYQQLMRLNGILEVGFTTKQLKVFFGLKDEDYVYNNKFNRALFEKKTVDVAIKEINETSNCIKNLVYEKAYKGRNVSGYIFKFDYIDPNDANRQIPVSTFEWWNN